MTKQKSTAINIWLDFYELCKPRIVALLSITAIVGMLLAVPTISDLPLDTFFFSIIGITLVSAAAAAINQIIEEHIDQKMKRTQKRPLIKGNITKKQAIVFTLIITIIGEALLFQLVNPLTAVLTFLGLIGYAIIYTVYLKHATPQNIVIGGISGAVPPILGWVAITGELSLEPFLLFLIIFIWTPPHFWALAIHRKDDYAKVNIPMLPVTHGIPYTRQQVLYYKILLIPVSLLPFIIGMSGLIYLISALILGLWYLYYGVSIIHRPNDTSLPMKSFSASIRYLLFIFIALIFDHYWLIT